MIFLVEFSPLLPVWVLSALAGLACLILGFAAWRRLAGVFLRGLAVCVVLAALANPSLREEERIPIPDIGFLVVDRSDSMAIGARPVQLEEAERIMRERLQGLAANPDAPLEIQVIEVDATDVPEGHEAGSYVLTALQAAAVEVAPDRIAGALILSDGQIHDAESFTAFPAPVHLLLVGQQQEWDRRLVVTQAPAFGIVGEEVSLTIRVEENGAVPAAGGRIPLVVALDGQTVSTVPVPLNRDISFTVAITRAGQNVLQMTLPVGEGELTDRNNTALVAINGVRDRLRVLLVSGEPHPGGRTWRNLLKADPSVDLVHFTILRPPEKRDGVPVFEMSLIAFPTRELFMEKIDEFDLIIFDRYRRRGVLPLPYLANIERYVDEGGAVLIATGPAFAGVESLYRTPLRDIMPAEPTARILEEGYLPRINDLGIRHPVTSGLLDAAPRPVLEDGTPGWGRWFRMIELEARRGDVVMEGPDQSPLLILDRYGAGRVAMLASDHAWLWSRGYEGGGPQQELLRRLAHWLMKEPELEEDVLVATGDTGNGLLIERRSLRADSAEVAVTRPDDSQFVTSLAEVSPGRFLGQADVTQDGLYRLQSDGLERVVAVGPAAPQEFINPLASPEVFAPVTEATGGGVVRVVESLPRLRRVSEGRSTAGRGWLGLIERGSYRVEDVHFIPLAPGWLVLLLIGALTIGAWRIESR